VFRYIAKYNIHLGLAAAISGFSYSLLLNNYVDIRKSVLLFFIQFLVVAAAYNYFRKRIKLTWQLPLVAVIILSFFFDYYFQLLLFSIGTISFLYQLPSKNKIGFRFYPYLKPFIIGLCWAVIIILLTAETAVFDGKILDFSILLFVLKFLEISALCIANDLLQIPKDKMNGLKTFPITYGVNVSKISVLLLSSMQLIVPIYFLVCMIIQHDVFKISILLLLFSMILSFVLITSSVLCIHRKKVNGIEYLLDVIIGIEALLVIASYYIS
jgi:4-hydroxybenzoate polyprenyltransferase